MDAPDPLPPINTGQPRSPEEFLAQADKGYVGTPMEDAQAALEQLQVQVEPILAKLEEAAALGTKDKYSDRTNSVWIKSQEARQLLEWIITILNHSQILQVQIEAATNVIGQLDAEIKRINDGVGLWTPGGDAPELSTP